MAVETGNYVEDLNSSYPDGASEYVYEGDNHLRLLKKCIKQTFTGFSGAVAVYGSDTTNTNSYAINPTTALVGYTAGLILVLKVTNANTGAVTVNISSKGAKSCTLPDGSAIPAGLMEASGYSVFLYNGTKFLLLYPTVYFGATAYFSAEYNNGNSSTADTINWTLGNKQKSTMTADCTYTFTAPNGPCNLILKLAQNATGGWTPTWPATVKWSEGVAPSVSTGGTDVDIISFYFDGTNYYGSLLRNCY